MAPVDDDSTSPPYIGMDPTTWHTTNYSFRSNCTRSIYKTEEGYRIFVDCNERKTEFALPGTLTASSTPCFNLQGGRMILREGPSQNDELEARILQAREKQKLRG